VVLLVAFSSFSPYRKKNIYCRKEEEEEGGDGKLG
jgi:hypothetical protein